MIQQQQKQMWKRNKYSLAIDLLLWSIKNNKFWDMLDIVLGSIKLGYSWQESIEKANGTYFPKAVKLAADNYKAKYVKETTVDIPGYDKWLASQKGENK